MALQRRCGERGQTIVLVAISIVSLLAMAALAIDVVSLYVARSEVQRAADAAALVGAKAVADSGVTSVPPGDAKAPAAKALAASMALASITGLLSATPTFNPVAGSAPTLVGTPTIDYLPSGGDLTNDATVTVTLQRTGLPTFFARIFGQTASTTSATAIAEAYNPANLQSFNPVVPQCVKPWLVANKDPITSTPFVDATTGAVEPGGGVGARFLLSADCDPLTPGCRLVHAFAGSAGIVDYVPAVVTANPANRCPACAGASDYERSISCCDTNSFAYSQCGNVLTASKISWDRNISPNPVAGGPSSPTALATECLIHATSTGLSQGQDSIINDLSTWPASGAPQITSASSGNLVTTSSSIVTIPLIDPAPVQNTPPFEVTVVGFLQAFVNGVQAGGTPPDIDITVLNVVGCSNTPNGNNPISVGNGTSAIAVRLIRPSPP